MDKNPASWKNDASWVSVIAGSIIALIGFYIISVTGNSLWIIVELLGVATYIAIPWAINYEEKQAKP